MTQRTGASGRPLEQFREYLILVARLQIGPELRREIDPSDLVQQTLLKAHENRSQFRGATDAERAAWLRAILLNHVRDAYRRVGQNPVRLFEESSLRLEAWLAAVDLSPSQLVDRSIQFRALAEAMARLPVDQRTALELRYLEGQSVVAVARKMNRSSSSVAGLLHRGLKALKGMLRGAD
jgi:RNA polymerase sigma-70 factor (ECF subfamily)